MKNEVDRLYLAGRNTVMGDGELESLLQQVNEDFFIAVTALRMRAKKEKTHRQP